MTSPIDLLEGLRSLGVRFSLVGDEVEIDGPTETLLEATIIELRRFRAQLRILLRIEETRPCGCEPIPGSVSALELKRHLGWDSFRFSKFCFPLLKRPGPASVDDDRLVLNAMLRGLREGAS